MLSSRAWCSYKALLVRLFCIELTTFHSTRMHVSWGFRRKIFNWTLYVSLLHIRFYKELGLPDGREAAMERGEGSPTLNVIKGWISREGRNATVQTLIRAVNRSERKDCSYFLEKSLGCQLDCVDSPMENVTNKMSSLSKYSESARLFTLTGTKFLV